MWLLIRAGTIISHRPSHWNIHLTKQYSIYVNYWVNDYTSRKRYSFATFSTSAHKQLFNSRHVVTTEWMPNWCFIHVPGKHTINSRTELGFSPRVLTCYIMFPGFSAVLIGHVPQTPKCTSFISHDAPFCNRNVHTHVHASVTKCCIVGYVSNALWGLSDRPIHFI